MCVCCRLGQKYLAVKAKLDIHRADLQLLQYQLDKILLAVGQPTATPATPGEPSSRVIFSQLRLSVLPAALTDGTFNNIRVRNSLLLLCWLVC